MQPTQHIAPYSSNTTSGNEASEGCLLTASYHLEMGDEPFEPTPNVEKSYSKPFSRRTLAVFSACIVVSFSWRRAAMSNSPTKYYNLPNDDRTFKDKCQPENIQTLQGALACEQACSAGTCCHDQCWEENKSLCLEYHHSCTILDGMAFSTGEPHNLLPEGYYGGWFEQVESRLHHHHHDMDIGKKPLPTLLSLRDSFPLLHGHEAREAACQQREPSRKNFRDCVHLCMPAACCFDDAHEHPAICHSVIGVEIRCEDYKDCGVLY